MDTVETEFHDEDVEAVWMQKGKGPSFGSCWTCGGDYFARSCQKGDGSKWEVVMSDVRDLLGVWRYPFFGGMSKW